MELSLLVDDQLQDVQRPACKGERVEIDFEQAGGSGRVLLVENRSASGQFNNSGGDVYGALNRIICEWYDAGDANVPLPRKTTCHYARDATLKRPHIVNPALHLVSHISCFAFPILLPKHHKKEMVI